MTTDHVPTQETFEQRRMALADYILEHPGEFDMDYWGYRTACGAAGCIAGNAVFQAVREGLCHPMWFRVHANRAGFEAVTRSDGSTQSVAQFAQDYLDLPDKGLFSGFDLTPETAAKALLEAPYLSHRRRSRDD